MMLGMRGGLITESFAKTDLRALAGLTPPTDDERRELLRRLAAIEQRLGPAAGVRAIADVAVVPLLGLLGYQVISRTDTGTACRLVASAGGRSLIALASLWAAPPEALRRATLLAGIEADARWCLVCNGQCVRLIDAHRPWSRRYLEFELGSLPHDTETADLFWMLLRAPANAGGDPLLDRAAEQSARHGLAVCRTLSDGMLRALDIVIASFDARRQARTRQPPDAMLEQALTVLYRVLFLLFAEARALVPIWHPVYRDRYTIDAIVTALITGRRYRGIWPALQAISRLAHAGCRAGELRVTAFNGRLFSPTHTPAAERAHIDDTTMARAVLAVSTSPSRGAGRQRILYHDLDVEQLGAVYEQVLDYDIAPGTRDGAQLARTGDRRKSTGTFYTPRALTDWLVRHTVAPLLEGKTAPEILSLRILDPAMGSGAFLVSACRHLAAAAEAAFIRDGEWHCGDVTEEDRIALRREVSQRCLYGADLNPMAVQLARLSLWLATLAHEKPLTFLDHHLIVGDSLVGATPADIRRQPPGRSRSQHRKPLPLFGDQGFEAVVEDALPVRLQLALEPDDDVHTVRRKESSLAALQRRETPRFAWKSMLDLWCACWFWRSVPRPDAALYGELLVALQQERSSLPAAVSRQWLAESERISEECRFLHWELEFPEVFFDERGTRRPDAGFDAVVGNPPWDVIRADSGDDAARASRRHAAEQLVSFVRDSGVYATSTRAHANRYQLFVERSLQLTRAGGRIGLVLPGGVVTDTGCGPLRRHLFDRARVDTVVGLDNRRGIFPIHRGLRFALLTATAGSRTERIACRFGITAVDDLEPATASGPADRGERLVLTRQLIERLSGDDDLGLPEIATATDLQILERISATIPRLSLPDGWHVQFGRELNATDDRGAFVTATEDGGARVVLEGKQIEPFRVDMSTCRYELSRDAAEHTRIPKRARLAYRDVAAATNRLTLIAAIVPARAVTTHTLFVLRTPMSLDRQLVLCALLNSFVANYLIRMRVNTHVTTGLMSRLAVPAPPPLVDVSLRLASLARTLAAADSPVEEMAEYAELQALVGRLYHLTVEDFEHVLSTFPLIDGDVKARCLDLFMRHHGPQRH